MQINSEVAQYKGHRNNQWLFWKNLEGKAFIKGSAVKHEPIMFTELPSWPWSEVGAEVFIFKSQSYPIPVDYYSRWIEAFPVTSQ